MDREQVIQAVEDAGLDYVQLEVVDPNGIGRGILLAREHLARAMERGINFSVTTLGVDLDDTIVNPDLGVEAGDFWAVLDPDSFVRLPYLERTGHAFADLVTEDAEPWSGCPRTALRRQTELTERERGTVTLGFEQEGWLIARRDGRPVPSHETPFFSFRVPNAEQAFLGDFIAALRVMGIGPEKVRSENGWGQIEFNIRYGPPLQAVEQLWRFKQAFRELARKHGHVGSFMPKPFPHLQGAGAHVHLGLRDAAGNDLFYDPADPRGLELSTTGYAFLGGLLAHAPAICAVGSPTINSYKRLQPGTWAPAHRGFAAGNRSVLIRVVESRPKAAGGPGAKRLELRSPDGTCNPYFLACAVQAAGLDGVRRGLDPGGALTGHDMGAISTTDRERLDAPELPRTLDQALDAFEADAVIRESLGPTLSEAFLLAKRSEARSHAASVSEWEFAHYLESF